MKNEIENDICTLKKQIKELEDKLSCYEDFPDDFENVGEWKSKNLHFCTDDNVILGIGSAEIENLIVTSRFDIKLLEKAIAALKKLDISEVDVIVGNECPIGFGKVVKDNQFVGIIIAPRVDEQ